MRKPVFGAMYLVVVLDFQSKHLAALESLWLNTAAELMALRSPLEHCQHLFYRSSDFAAATNRI